MGGLSGLSGMSGMGGLTGKQDPGDGAAAVFLDAENIETRLVTGNVYELKCPVCQEWRRSLLTTTAGTVCSVCWRDLRGDG